MFYTLYFLYILLLAEIKELKNPSFSICHIINVQSIKDNEAKNLPSFYIDRAQIGEECPLYIFHSKAIFKSKITI